MSETFRDFRPGRDEPGVAELWGRCFGEAVGGQTVDWLFREGPGGACPRSVAERDGRIVAHAGAMALCFRLGDQMVRGGYSVGAMTDPELRGRGLFVRIGQHLYERMERDGFAFVAGFSNAQSHRIMTGPLGRVALRPFPWAVRPLRPMGILSGVLRRGSPPDETPLATTDDPPLRADDLEVASCAPADPRLDALWERCAAGIRVGCVRDVAFARSRFDSRPDAGYRGLLVRRGDVPLAWAVHRMLTLRGLRACFLVDLLVAPGEPRAGRLLLQRLTRDARARGAVIASALLPGEGDARRVLRRAGYLPVPERLHPQLIRFSVRGLGAWADSPLLADPRAWQLSWADTDVV